MAYDQSRLLGVSPLSLAKREPTDRSFTFGYLLLGAVAVAFGCYGGANSNFEELTNFPPSCEGEGPSPPLLGRLAVSASNSSSTIEVIESHLWVLPIVAAVVTFVGYIWVHLLKTCARPVTFASVIMIPFVFCATGFGFLSQPGLGDGTPAYVCFGFAALAALMILCCRRSLNLTAGLLEQAAVVLSTHPGLLLVGVLLLLGGLLLYSACAVAAVALLSTGHWAPSGACEWQLAEGAAVGLGVIGAFALWSLFLSYTLRFFVVSLTTAIWYFDTASAATLPAPSAAPGLARTAPVRLSVALAFTKSFGTMCYSSLVVTICHVLNRMAEQAMRRSNSLAALLVGCCLRCIVSLIQYINKFAVAYHAITAKPFCASARGITSMLGRHGLSAWFVDRIGGFVLGCGSLALACVSSGFTSMLLYSSMGSGTDAVLVTGVFAGLTLCLGWLVLGFCSSLLLNIVDAAYTCLAIEFDDAEAAQRAAYQPQFRDAMLLIVKPTAVVAQPGDAVPVIAVPVAAAQPQQPQQGAPMGQPVVA